MAWTIEFNPRVLRRIGSQAARRILDYLRDRVAVLEDPRQLGQPLKGSLAALWRYRIGDYRVICELHDEVLVLRIGHRKAVYR